MALLTTLMTSDVREVGFAVTVVAAILVAAVFVVVVLVVGVVVFAAFPFYFPAIS